MVAKKRNTVHNFSKKGMSELYPNKYIISDRLKYYEGGLPEWLTV